MPFAPQVRWPARPERLSIPCVRKPKLLGATTSFSASEVASLMTELGRAGFSPKQIEEMTGAVMNLARATGTDATLSSGIMAATIRQFSMAATDAVRVADGLTAAANKSFNSVESLGEALSYAGPVAADANMSLEETLAILGTLGNLGIQGSEAGTALRRLLTLSASESEKFQKVFGVATKDAQGNARKLVDVLGEVAAATANMGSGIGPLRLTKSLVCLVSRAHLQLANQSLTLGNCSARSKRRVVSPPRPLPIGILELAEPFEFSRARSGRGHCDRRVTRSLSDQDDGCDLTCIVWIHRMDRRKNQEVVKKVALSTLAWLVFGAAFIGIGGAAGVAAFGGRWSGFNVLELVWNRDRRPCDHDRRSVHSLGLVVAAIAADWVPRSSTPAELPARRSST